MLDCFYLYVNIVIMKKRLLITGGAGFIGSSVYDKLKNTYDCFIIDNFDDMYSEKIKLRNLGLEKMSDIKKMKNVKTADITDRDALEKIFKKGFDAVIHCAAMAGVRSSFEKPAKYYKVNVEGSINLLEMCRLHGVKKFLFLSSSSVYGNNKKIPFKEDFAMKPISFYAHTKCAAEEAVMMYTRHFGLDAMILRLFTVYGPRQRPDLAIHKFFLQHRKGEASKIFGSLSTKRDYTYIEDAVSGIKGGLQYLMRRRGALVLNIGSSNPILMRNMIKEIKRIVPDFSYEIAEPAEGDMEKTFADISRAKEIIGYSPRENFGSGLKKFSLWFKEAERND